MENDGEMCNPEVSLDPPTISDLNQDKGDDVPLTFPSSNEVCETEGNSALNSFNPLVESEPNLKLCESSSSMTDENQHDKSTDLTETQILKDVSKKDWIVTVRKLSLEEIDFLSGPKLLPNLTLPNAINTSPLSDHDNPPPSTEEVVTSRPKRESTKSVSYIDQCLDEDDGEEYIPPEDEANLSDNSNVANANRDRPKHASTSESDDNVPLIDLKNNLNQ